MPFILALAKYFFETVLLFLVLYFIKIVIRVEKLFFINRVYNKRNVRLKRSKVNFEKDIIKEIVCMCIHSKALLFIFLTIDFF